MGSPDVIIAVLDSGTDWMHPDIGMGENTYQNIFLNSGEDIWQNINNPLSGNGVDDDENGFIDDWKGWNFDGNNNDVRTINGHGTRVAGIVAAKSNNNIGIAGIAGGNNSQGARIMPICVGVNAPNGAILDDAIIYAVNNGARVIQLSLAVARTNAIDAAIAFAIENDVVIVCASGNNSSSLISYPANQLDVIAVGATAQNNTRANFSNYGATLDVVAPGVDILSTTLGNGYNSQDGTSFSAPQISGVAALILSINPCLTQSEVRNIIESTAQKVGGYSYTTTAGRPNGIWTNQMGYGLINANAAVQKARLFISGPTTVCSTGATFTLNNLPSTVNSIIWTHGPNLTITSGQNTPNCTFSAIGNGSRWVRATLVTDCGDLTLPQQTVWVGVPINSSISFGAFFSPPTFYNQILRYQDVTIGVISNPNASVHMVTGYEWQFWSSPSWEPYVKNYQSYNGFTKGAFVINLPSGANSSQTIVVSAVNSCGHSFVSSEETPFYAVSSYILKLSPNPSNGIVIMEIQNPDKENLITNWDLEVYDQSQRLITRQSKIKGNAHTINTSGWEKGVYIVTASYNGEHLSEKLVVK